MDLQASTVVIPADILTFHAPAVDVAGVGASALVNLAIAMLRVSAVAGLLSPLLVVHGWSCRWFDYCPAYRRLFPSRLNKKFKKFHLRALASATSAPSRWRVASITCCSATTARLCASATSRRICASSAC